MTTLQSIAFTLAGGMCVAAVSLVAFALAVRARHVYIAPRCTARPKDVIYQAAPQHSCQDRGSPMWGWIPWTLGLTYDTMLRGVPGTGTREGGMAGSMLRVKLDGIVLLRFHTMAMKVSGLATVLLIGIILPAYTSGQCHIRSLASEDGLVDGCATGAYNVTNYERTTIANVPSLSDVLEPGDTLFVTQNGILGRLYAVNFVMWIVTAYLLYCLKDEWIQILAMRRVYYLECDIWEERCAELRETLLHQEYQKRERKKKTHFTFEETKKKKEEERHLIDRNPWIPHPEQRDTVPNIALYSVLVGGLPSLPEQAIDPMNGGDAITLTQRDSIDWQLSLTAAFFDHCVPNQPGFSSSVAAVSIMPSSQAIAVAWRRWYKAARKLRRLRFIREQIAQRRHYDIIVDTPDGGEQMLSSTRNLASSSAAAGSGDRQSSTRGFMVSPWFSAAGEEDNASPLPIYQTQDKNRDYYREVLGSVRDQETDRQVYEAFHFGPEQTAVYSREFAQSSAACCPYGCFEGSIRRAKIDELIQMEREAAEIVHEANLALLKARRMAVRWEQNFDDNDNYEEEHGDEEQAIEKPPSMQEEHRADAGDLGESRKTLTSIAEATPPPKSAPSTPPNTDKKESKHRRKPTIESLTFPENMNLEVELFARAASGEMNRSRANSATGGGKTQGSSAPGTAKKAPNHRRKPSLENMQFSGDLGLESELFHRANSGIGTASKKRHGHRRNVSLDGVKLPVDLSLEVDVLHRVSSDQDLTKTSSRELFDRDTSQTYSSFTNTEANIAGTAKKQVSDLSLNSSNEPLSRQNSNVTSHHVGSSGSGVEPLVDLDDTPKVGNLETMPSDEDSRNMIAQQSAAEAEVDLEAREAQQLTEESQWTLVQSIVANVSQSERSYKKKKNTKKIASGAWNFPSLRSLIKKTGKTATTGATKVVKTVTDTARDAIDIQRESSYAVVTFTSRQAAVAARHCLADGRGTDRWISNPELPIPPLADAASGDILACRNCCKPVTLSIDDRQKDYRRFCALALLATIYVFYTIPLTAASRFVDPESIEEVFPNLSRWVDENWNDGAELISGLLQSSIWTLFFALCPVMFRAISNFGSGATSAADAEYKALIYFWYFMTISAFSTTLISNMFLNGLNNSNLGGEFREVLREIARTIPSVQAVSWLNWIIFRFTILLPVNYLLNINPFLFSAIDFRCCARVAIGGGPGMPTPYRIYVDSGVVLLCLMALGPSSPLVAPACFAYYLVFQPILRRNLIFMYRPRFDGGGFRWPVIFDICISCCVVGQILLTMQMILKEAVGPAVAAAIPIMPTILFHRAMRRKYLRAFEDAALLQTSMLDGWDSVGESSMEKREEFRRFLVDAHKAAYIPVCIASGNEEEALTAEPAVVVPLETDVQKDLLNEPLYFPYQSQEAMPQEGDVMEVKACQHGATLRRAVNSLAALRRRSESGDSTIFASMRNLNIMPQPSPFDRRASLTTHSQSLTASGRRAAFRQLHDAGEKEE